jgi:hypothetical protein
MQETQYGRCDAAETAVRLHQIATLVIGIHEDLPAGTDQLTSVS